MSFSKSQYDQPAFYSEYKQLDRSQVGLQAAGEWPSFQSMLPSLQGKKCLDIGCGCGWHCLYAISQGAASVLGIDHSQNMLQVAREKSRCLPLADQDRVQYLQLPMEQLTEWLNKLLDCSNRAGISAFLLNTPSTPHKAFRPGARMTKYESFTGQQD
ncbi:S-adenosyl-L-methionine-dependent methyltransferase [Hesseltinella vesiculosa]|uniref:S-adenosyl-L-methionine-dependent methyltransferase n=1 Tax=Hesseltinella vesiculosa TaxID=101127 RepID=A0A1X2GHK3_9FUNG|nr:S-adenosyl-L-methionine-dependent methyltransferase [Hesseltinella vesiculosa]